MPEVIKNPRRGRKGSAPPDRADQSRKMDQSIDQSIKAVIQYVLSEGTIEEQAALFRSFPPNVQASLITQYIPKQKETEQALVESHLSLVKSYDRLPSIEDLTERCRILRVELIHLQSQARTNEYHLEKLCIKLDWKRDGLDKRYVGTRRRFLYLARKIQTDMHKYYKEKDYSFITPERWAEVADEVLLKFPKLEDAPYTIKATPTKVDEEVGF